MSDRNKNTEPSPFHKKGGEGDSKKNFMGRKFSSFGSIINPLGGFGEGETYGEDEWGIKAAQGKVNKAFGEFSAIDTGTNLWEGAENLMNIRDNYENTMEDLTVNQQQAQFQSQQGSQQRANILGGLKSSAGGSGVGGLAQAMANQGQLQTQQISASIGQQESANQMAKARQGASIQQQQRQSDIAMGQGAMEAQKFQLQGAADARDLTLQQKQGELSFLAGQLGANEANKDADTAGKSDRRLKKNIVKIGESREGLNIYSFEYKDSLDGSGVFQGVMSDEIPQEAVTSVDGYDRVNYSMLDVEFKQI